MHLQACQGTLKTPQVSSVSIAVPESFVTYLPTRPKTRTKNRELFMSIYRSLFCTVVLVVLVWGAGAGAIPFDEPDS